MSNIVNRKLTYSSNWPLSDALESSLWGPTLRLADRVEIKTKDNITFLDVDWKETQFLLASMLMPRLIESKYKKYAYWDGENT